MSRGYAPVTDVRSVTVDGLATEAERTTHRALVAVQRRGLRTSGEVEVVASVVVAVERRDAAADEEVGVAVVPVDDARGSGLVHVSRSLRRPCPVTITSGCHNRDTSRRDQRGEHEHPPTSHARIEPQRPRVARATRHALDGVV